MLAAGAGVVVLGAGGAVALAATSGGGPGKRYATIGRASITEVVEASGTITSSDKVTPSFPVSGTVRAVDVTVGQSVRKGQALARLDTTSLQDAVDSAELGLANARQRLAADESGQTSAGSGGGSNSAGPGTNSASFTALTATPAPPAGGSGTSTGPAALIKQIRTAQQDVRAAQQAIDAGQAAVDTAQQTVDAAVTQNTALRDAQKQACDADASSDACTSARADYETYADTLAAAAAALDAKIGAQDAAVKALDAAIAALDKLLGQLSSTSTGAGGTGGGGTGTGGTGTGGTGTGGTRTGGTGTGGTGTGGTGTGGTRTGGTGSTGGTGGTGSPTSSGGRTASASQLAADQAAIDSAQAQVRAAEQDLAAATLRSPITGKVALIGFTAGAGSSGRSITIIGTGVQKVSTSVPLAQVGLVKVGQEATVAADGLTTSLHGTVASIGILSSTSGSTTTFPVTLQLAAGSPTLYDGVGADVSITTGSARDVVVVPNSAIHSGFRGSHSVTVLRGSKTSTVLVTLGVAGPALSEVKSGLKVGDRVLVADYATSVPASTNSNNSPRNLTRLLNGIAGGNRPVFIGGR